MSNIADMIARLDKFNATADLCVAEIERLDAAARIAKASGDLDGLAEIRFSRSNEWQRFDDAHDAASALTLAIRAAKIERAAEAVTTAEQIVAYYLACDIEDIEPHRLVGVSPSVFRISAPDWESDGDLSLTDFCSPDDGETLPVGIEFDRCFNLDGRTIFARTIRESAEEWSHRADPDRWQDDFASDFAESCEDGEASR
jgi:hypothetical protein